MKNVYLRSMVALACAASLVACGGSGKGNLALSGSVKGLIKNGLVLTNGSKTLNVAANATSFTFPDLISTDDEFNVVITNPPGTKCSIVNGKGKANSYNTTTLAVTCIPDPYKLGGSITGLTSSGLVLINGNDQLSVAPGTTSFVFPATVGDGQTYGVTVLTQPSTPVAQTCTVNSASGTGVMGSADVLNLQVNCQ